MLKWFFVAAAAQGSSIVEQTAAVALCLYCGANSARPCRAGHRLASTRTSRTLSTLNDGSIVPLT